MEFADVKGELGSCSCSFVTGRGENGAQRNLF